jgi:hypothetical protein
MPSMVRRWGDAPAGDISAAAATLFTTTEQIDPIYVNYSHSSSE